MKIHLIFLLIVPFLNSCNQNNAEYLKKWKHDKQACNGIRNLKDTKYLFEKLKVEKYDSKKLILMIGNPDRIYITKQYVLFEYYIENNCSTNEDDVCLVSFTYNSNIKNSTPEISFICN